MAFSAEDIVPDSPTNNFATLNPLNLRGATLYDGSLQISGGGNNTGSFATIPIQKTDKWYIEVRTNDTTTDTALFLKPSKYFNLNRQDEDETIAILSYGTDISIREYSSGYTDLGISTGQSRTTTGDVLGYLIDLENNTITVYKNGVHKIKVTNLTPVDDVYFVGYNVDTTWAAVNKTFNFGQDPTFGGNENTPATVNINGTNVTGPFAPSGTAAGTAGLFYYPPPADALALCTANLPDFTPTVVNDTPQDYFKAVTYSGSIGNDQLVDCGFPADFIWIKGRTATFNTEHLLYDTLRGRTSKLSSHDTGSEYDYSTHPNGDLAPTLSTASNSLNGFKTSPVTNNNMNNSGSTYVAWFWRAGGAPSADDKAMVDGVESTITGDAKLDAGTITPTRMSVNTKAGFSIVSFIGDGTNTATVSHGLNSTPELTIVKDINAADNWQVKYIPSNFYLVLDDARLAETVYPNYTATSSVINLGYSWNNDSSNNHIAYCWHSVEGYSKFGSYTGNQSADGPFVYTGFRPAFVMIKETGNLGNWHIYDIARPAYNPAKYLLANEPDQEGGTTYVIDNLSNGFKIRNDGNGTNRLSGNFIYMAFAEQPFKYSNAR